MKEAVSRSFLKLSLCYGIPVYLSTAITSTYLKSGLEEPGAELDGSGTQVSLALHSGVVIGPCPEEG